jgi:ketosteroid isomerase-like protein
MNLLRWPWLSLPITLSLSLVSAAHAGDERDVVMDLTQQACEAFRTADLGTVEKLLAPTFNLVSSDATVQPRAAVIAEIRNREPAYDVFRNHSMTAQVYGDAAVVQGITHVKGTSGGHAFEVQVRFSDTLIRNTEGRWQLVVSHVTRIPEPVAVATNTPVRPLLVQ